MQIRRGCVIAPNLSTEGQSVEMQKGATLGAAVAGVGVAVLRDARLYRQKPDRQVSLETKREPRHIEGQRAGGGVTRGGASVPIGISGTMGMQGSTGRPPRKLEGQALPGLDSCPVK
jgi:hypothetical protein